MKMMSRRTALSSLAGTILGGQFAATGRAQDRYPIRPVRMSVPFAPGGGAADVTARALAQQMGVLLGQPVVVENRPGAGGAIGTLAVAKAAPDGYTILLTDRGALGILPSINPQLGYDPLRSFAHIGVVTEGPYVLVVHQSVAAKTIPEFASIVRGRAGKINYGSFGVGSMAHLNFEAMNARFGLDMQHVPYKNTPEAINAVANGEVQIAMAAAPAVIGVLRAGQIRALAIGAPVRSPELPDVPTAEEAGMEADILVPTYFALAAPIHTPDAICARLAKEMQAALSVEDVARRLTGLGLTPVGSGREVTERLIRRDSVVFGELIKRLKITAQ